MSVEQAQRRHRAGDRSGAERLYREAIRRDPAEAAAWHGLGMLAAEAGNFAEARRRFERALRLVPSSAIVLSDLARVAHAEGRLDEALDLVDRAAQSTPDDPGPSLGRVMLLGELGRHQEAIAAAEALTAKAPRNAEGWMVLGTVARRGGDLARAIEAYRSAARVAPRLIAAHHNLGAALNEGGEHAEAETVLRAAIALDPKAATLHVALGVALRQLDRVDEAIAAYRAALALSPQDAMAWFNLGIALKARGETEAAIEAFETAAEIDPTYLAARWGAVLTLPIVYDDMAAIDAWRQRWRKGLAALEAALDLATPRGRASALAAVSSSTNFFLHYQGRNDRDDQARYGALVHRIAAASYPDLVAPPRRERPAGERIRVGFVSAFLHHHSIFKTHGAFAIGLDPKRFDVHWFYAGARIEEARSNLEGGGAKGSFVGAPAAAMLMAALRQAMLDIVIHLDIGMDPGTQLLAALRFAPVQANFGGHPVTSGLPTIDWFLTSDLMEPPGGEAFYTEEMVRLPNLASCYPPPPVDRADPPLLPADARGPGPVFLNLQSLFKLRPDFDALYPAIAKRVGRCRFWFLRGSAPTAAARFAARLARAFAEAGLDAEEYVRIVPPQPQLTFYGLIRACDVVLDGLPWSGNNSSMEALACGKPIVTWPQDSMRSRHSAAILAQLGLPELIAKEATGFVEIAARLGTDAAYRAGMEARIMANRDRIFGDRLPVEALAAWIERVA